MRLSRRDSYFQYNLDENKEKFGIEPEPDIKEIKKIALGIYKNTIFYSLNIPDYISVRQVFLPLFFLTDHLLIPYDACAFYAEYSYKLSMSINGYPMFSSFHYLRPKEFDLLNSILKKLYELEEDIFNAE